MTRIELHQQIQRKQSYLCVGLDPNPDRIPTHLHHYDDPIFEFNKRIIDATQDLCIAYKPNLAFYEALGMKGWESLQKTLDYIPDEHFTIADAKRGDIGNTAHRYAEAYFKTLNFDAITVAPYMGADSVLPFLQFPDKWVILLALTSNQSSVDFQRSPQEHGEPLYQKVIQTAVQWGTPEQLMFVVGATHPNELKQIRELVPDHFLLVPGVGAQGGDMETVIHNGKNTYGGVLVNVARSILYASQGKDFAEKARLRAKQLIGASLS